MGGPLGTVGGLCPQEEHAELECGPRGGTGQGQESRAPRRPTDLPSRPCAFMSSGRPCALPSTMPAFPPLPPFPPTALGVALVTAGVKGVQGPFPLAAGLPGPQCPSAAWSQFLTQEPVNLTGSGLSVVSSAAHPARTTLPGTRPLLCKTVGAALIKVAPARVSPPVPPSVCAVGRR